MQVRSAVERLRAELEECFGDRLLEVRLFGSAARGEMHEGSDVDVFVLLDRLNRQDWTAVFEVVGRLRVELELVLMPTVMVAVQCALWRAQGRPLVAAIDREGVSFRPQKEGSRPPRRSSLVRRRSCTLRTNSIARTCTGSR